MKALSVRQPWAWLIVTGHKDIENRTWRTSHRGLLLIHASQTVDRDALAYFRADFRREGIPWPRQLHTGALVGTVTVVDCVTRHPSDWFSGPIGWVLANPGEFPKPVPARGALGLWEYPGLLPEDLEWEDA